MKKVLPTILALIVFLGAYGYFINFKETNEAVVDNNIYIWKLKKNKITNISISNENETIQLKRNGNTWDIVYPVKYPADTFNANAILSSFFSPLANDLVEENSSNLKNYGIPSSKVSITLIDDEEVSNTLILGDTAPLSKGYYVCNNNNKNIYTMNSNTWDDLFLDLYSLRDKSLFSFKKEYVDKITIESKGKTFTINSREENGKTNWYSNDKLLDEASVRSLITVLNGKTISQFMEDNANSDDLEKYGLKNPRATLMIYLNDDDTPVLYLYVGNIEDSSTYVTKDKKFIYKVHTSSLLPEDLSIKNFTKKNK